MDVIGRWAGHSPETLQAMRDGIAASRARGRRRSRTEASARPSRRRALREHEHEGQRRDDRRDERQRGCPRCSDRGAADLESRFPGLLDAVLGAS